MSVVTVQPAYTDQQKAIVRWVPEGTGHAVAIALAGTGKTWTALQAVRFMAPSFDRKVSITIVMFNHDIAEETSIKIAEDGLRAWSTTFHAAGNRAMMIKFPKTKLSGFGPKKAGVDKFTLIIQKLDIPKTYQEFAYKAMSMAKQRAFGILCKLNDPAAWLKLVDDYDLDTMISADYLDSGLRPREDIIKEGLQWAYKALKYSNTLLDTIIDHDDQIYGPLILDLKMFENDWLIIDEAQDTNPARRLLARKMLKQNGGRALWIGDPNQSIYAFTGADADAMDIIAKEWKAKIFYLTCSFRCPQVVARMVQEEYVSEFRAAPGNIEGEYLNVSDEDFYKNETKKLSMRTVILCRNTGPLVKAAFRLLGQGIACYVEGKDIGIEVIELVNRWGSIKKLSTLRERLQSYLEDQTTKLTALGKDRQLESLNDRVETVFAIMEGLEKGATLDDFKATVDRLFQKTKKGEKAPDRIRLMTIHRSKGLEARTIVFIGRQSLIPSKFAVKEKARQQELNLAYVGMTRVQEKLIEVRVAA